MREKYDVIIVGTGVAGLNAALHMPRERRVLVICKGTPDRSDSYLAQGGICRLQGEDDYQSYLTTLCARATAKTTARRSSV